MGTPVNHTVSGIDVLRPIEGDWKWSGPISISFLVPGNSAQELAFQTRLAALNAKYGSTITTGLAAVPGTWQDQIGDAIAAWNLVANFSAPSIVVGSATANYIISDDSVSGDYGFWDFPNGAGVAGFGLTGGNAPEAEMGGSSDRYYTFLHEFGHALGLAHPHDMGQSTTTTGAPSGAQPAPYRAQQTVMSYDVSADNVAEPASYGRAITPMALDIAAVQAMYGAKAALPGDTTYRLFDANTSALDVDGGDGAIGVGRAYYCIWDTGGDDTLRYDGTQATLLNLNSATLTTTTPADIQMLLDDVEDAPLWSTLALGVRQQLQDGGYQAGGFFSSILAAGGERTAGGFTIAFGAIVEHARGGGGNDLIIGNAVNNRLLGQAGDDNLYGAAGDDTLQGAAGDDVLHGGDGNDIVTFGDPVVRVDVIIDGADDPDAVLASSEGGANTETLIKVERLRLSDQADRVRVTDDGLLSGDLREIDALGHAGQTGDELDLTGLSGDVVYDEVQAGATGGAIPGSPLTFKSFEILRFGAGDDKVRSTTVNAEIYLGAGDDRLKHAAPGTRVWGDGGDDTFHLMDNIRIEDAEANDHVSYGGIANLTGGIHWVGSPIPYAMHISFVVGYGLNKVGDLVIHDFVRNREMFVADYVGGPGAPYNKAGIYIADIELDFVGLFDERPGHLTWLGGCEALFGGLMKANFGVSLWSTVDPLVFDLDGDGLELTGESLGDLVFDIDGDGYGERTGWVGADDGLLVLDGNSDGQVKDVGELFGGPGASGFAELATHDTNADGAINGSDAVFGQLRIWRDLDQDRVVDAGELSTLTAAGITSISVASTASSATVAGNRVLATGTFTTAGGATRSVSDVAFSADNQNTLFLGDKTISAAAAALPELKGYGTLPDLRVAMTLDSGLQATVNANLGGLATLDLAAMRAAAMPILTAWALASPVTGRPPLLAHDDVPLLLRTEDGSEVVADFAYEVTVGGATYWKLASGDSVRDGAGVIIAEPTLSQVQADTTLDGTWSALPGAVIAFFERYFGESLPLDTAPTGAGAVLGQMTGVLDGFWGLLNSISVRLAMQGPLASYFPGLEYDVEEDAFLATTARQLAPSFEAIFTQAAGLGSGALARIADWQDVLDVVIADFRQPDGLLNTNPFLFSNIVAAYESTGLTLSIVDVAGALGLPTDLIRTGTGAVAGGDGADIFYLSAGNQTLSGGLGPDTYVVGQGSGQDVIVDLEEADEAHSEDVLRFADIASTEVTARREGLDLIISVNGTSDEVRVKDHFDGRLPSISGGGDLSDSTGVDIIVFADGVAWTPFDVARAVSRPEAGAQTLAGTDTVDWLDGGGGDDSLSGGNDADVYVYGRGDGNDVINDAAGHIHLEGPDFLLFKSGITLGDVVFRRDGSTDNLIIEIVGESGSLKLIDQFAKTYTGPFGEHWINLIESFQFDDGSEISWQEVIARVLAASGTSGDDTIHGYSLPDDLAGGLGNDYLSGGNENDTYRYALGDGHDVIEENPDNFTGGMTDRVVFGAGVVPSAVTIQRVVGTEDAKFTFSDGGSLIVRDQFAATATGVFGNIWFDRVEQFTFTDAPSVSWTAEHVMQEALLSAKTTGADTVEGYWRQDTLDGGAGNDLLIGNEESDTYAFGRGYGHDTVSEGGPNAFQATDQDRVQLGADIAPTDVLFERAGTSTDLTLRISGTEDRLTLQGQNHWFGLDTIEEVRFSDGTTWTAAFMRAEFITRQQTAGADTIVGFYTADTLQGGAGDDRLEGLDGGDRYVFNTGDGADKIYEGYTSYVDRLVLGAGLTTANLTVIRSVTDPDDVTLSFGSNGSIFLDEQFVRNTNGEGVEEIQFGDGAVWSKLDLVAASFGATSGDDTMLGGDGADTLAGAGGNDRLEGLDGSDVYLFNAGDGADKIYEIYDISDADRLVLGAGLTPANLTFTRSTTDLDDVTLSFGASGSIFLDEQFDRNSPNYGIEQIEFGDGTLWSKLDLLNAYIAQSQTSGNDTVYGGDGGDTLQGGAGNDRLEGLNGADRYVFNAGDGADSIYEIYEIDDLDVLQLGSGLTPATLVIQRSTSDRDDVTLSFGAAGSIYIDEQFDRNTARYGIERFEFGDGTVWTKLDLLNAYIAQNQTAGNDTIIGGYDADTIAGLGGNDRLEGLEGADVYLFNSGDGADSIHEIFDAFSEADVLVLGTGLTPANLVIQRSGSDFDDVTLSFGASGSIFIDEQFDRTTPSYGVEEIRFGDSTVWTKSDLRAAYLAQNLTSGNDSVAGFSAADSLSAGVGNDTILGRDGDDTLSGGDGGDSLNGEADHDHLSGGDGADTIGGSIGNDTILGGAGFDRLTGSSGADRFVYTNLTDAPVGASPEIITDFSQGSDKIDLTAIDANTGTAGDQAFSFIGTAAFSNVAGQLRYAATPSGSRTVYGDVDGDSVADFQIQLTGSVTLAAGDFLL